jgi:asparagine synthase (glutamine-hydrolysing)
MNRVHIVLRNHPKWTQTGGASVCGAAFIAQTFKKSLEVSDYFSHIDTEDAFVVALKELNGFFAVVFEGSGKVYAAVDRVRSLPLFYGSVNGHLYLSDDAHWVREQVGDKERGRLAETEFLLAGYVTGADTISPNVKQLQAGEALFAQSSEKGVSLRTERYYRFVHSDDLGDDRRTLFQMLDQTVLSCMHRLLAWADGRTIVIPLSGGYDSRLIAAMLKRLGYQNLKAFSYGRPGNREAQLSQQVADNLGIPWLFVPYSNEAWRRWFYSPEREAYYRMAHGLSSLPHIQDWPAVWELQQQRQLGQDAVFVPGHTGDFVSGGHIPTKLLSAQPSGETALVDSVLRKHYSLWDYSDQQDELERVLHDRIIRLVETNDFDTPVQVANAYEKWEWQERQAKHIVNSVRVYDFWGHDWWLPLWDADVMAYWQQVPLTWRIGKRLYEEYVIATYAEVAKVGAQVACETDKDSVIGRMKDLVRQAPVFPLALRIYDQVKRRGEYDNHPLAWYGIMPEETFQEHYTGRETINSFLAKDILGQMSLE